MGKEGAVEDADQIDLDDSLQNCLFYFEDAARTLAAGPEHAVRQFKGHFATAWELRQEILIGASLLGWSGVSEALQYRIELLVALATNLPIEAWEGSDANELFHPAWADVRGAASVFLAEKGAE